MLTIYQNGVAETEFSNPIYDGMTFAQAWQQLTVGVPFTVTTYGLLTPTVVAKAIGPVKAEAVALAIKAAFPTIYSFLFESGIDPSDPNTQAFLMALVNAHTITTDDVTALTVAVVVHTTLTSKPSYDFRFHPSVYPSMDSETGLPDPTGASVAIHGFPPLGVAIMEPSDFQAAWTAAGRS